MSRETIEEIASQYARGYPDTDPAAIELSYRMSVAANAMRTASDRLFARFGPDRSRNRFGVVRVLYFSEAPELSQNRLSDALNLPPSTVTYFVDALEREGLVTITEKVTADSAEYVARVTKKGFPILGTAPSNRGPVYRAQICEKVYDGLRNFVRHPHEETVGHAELVWHYDNPRRLYPLVETKIDKPLKVPYISNVSFWYAKHQWKFEINVKKTRAA
jgi:DNA-binding MarR family transcriptional regulator